MTFEPEVVVVTTTSSPTDPTRRPFVDVALSPPALSTFLATWFVPPSIDGPAQTMEAVKKRAIKALRTNLV
jgi:hypothetical protein